MPTFRVFQVTNGRARAALVLTLTPPKLAAAWNELRGIVDGRRRRNGNVKSAAVSLHSATGNAYNLHHAEYSGRARFDIGIDPPQGVSIRASTWTPSNPICSAKKSQGYP